MRRGARADEKVAPLSVALTKEQKEAFEAEARKRGLGLSTTIRSLAVERTNDLCQQRQRERALRWQTKRLRALADHIEANGFDEASQAAIDAVFADAEARVRRASSATA